MQATGVLARLACGRLLGRDERAPFAYIAYIAYIAYAYAIRNTQKLKIKSPWTRENTL
jgi:hypothetical protein